MGLVQWKNKDGVKSWQSDGFGEHVKGWTRVDKNAEPIQTGIPPLPVDEDEETPRTTTSSK